MKILHYTKLTLLALAALVVTASCSEDEAEEKIVLTVQAVAPTTDDAVADYSTLQVKLSSQRDGKVHTATLNAAGTAQFTVDKGSYAIEIDGLINDLNYFGSTSVSQYATSQTVSIEVKHIVKAYSGKKDGLVFSEIFYNGGTYGGSMRHPDQYVVIANNTDHDIVCDSLVIAVASNMNTLPCNALTDLLPDYVAVANMYMIPGNGSTHVLKPGEQYVIASAAINHAANYDFVEGKDTGLPVNLEGADFELADEDARQDGKLIDNPEVENMIKLCNNLPQGVTAWMHPYGIRPVFMFDGSGIDWDSFKATNEITYKEKGNINQEIKEYHGYKIPTRLIIDGVETTSQTTPYWGNFETKSLPAEVDKSYAVATMYKTGATLACHSSTFMYRKTVGQKWQDTDDSSNDMTIEFRTDFAGFPKGWKN